MHPLLKKTNTQAHSVHLHGYPRTGSVHVSYKVITELPTVVDAVRL